jgi:hypothetical protein
MLVNDETIRSQDETHILHPSSRMLFRFWETMRAEHPAPRRQDLDLTQIRTLLPHLFITEYTARGRMFRWRLAGTAICELFRNELTGSNMLAGWDAFEADTISRFLSNTITNRQPCILRYRLKTDRGQIIGAELAGFPMLAADGVSTHIFGGVFAFRETHSLGYASVDSYELSAARSIWTENLPMGTPARSPDAPVLRNFQVISGGRGETQASRMPN